MQAAHQSLHHFVAKADWSDDAVLLAAVRARVLPSFEPHGPMRVLIIDDTGFPRKAAIQWALHDNIADNLVSRTFAR